MLRTAMMAKSIGTRWRGRGRMVSVIPPPSVYLIILCSLVFSWTEDAIKWSGGWVPEGGFWLRCSPGRYFGMNPCVVLVEKREFICFLFFV